MKILRSSLLGPRAALFVLPLLLGLSALALEQAGERGPDELDAAEVRQELTAMYEAWGRARVALDREAMEAILAPEFLVQLYGQEISREKFVTDVSQQRPGSRLGRFDASILTVQQTGEAWTVVIDEKLEFEIDVAEGQTQKLCSYWITRDGCRKEGERWLVTSSEAIGHQNWAPGEEPPIEDW